MPGEYVLDNGLSLSNSATLTSSGGVLIYVKGGAVSVKDSAQLTLTPQTSGPYEGVPSGRRAEIRARSHCRAAATSPISPERSARRRPT